MVNIYWHFIEKNVLSVIKSYSHEFPVHKILLIMFHFSNFFF